MLRPLFLFVFISCTGHIASAADFAGPNQFICGTATVLGADPLVAGESGFWEVVAGSADFSPLTSPTALATGLSFGENVLRWTVFTTGGPASDLVSIFCYDSAMPDANAGPDQVVLSPPGTAQMSASSPTAPALCFWTVIAGVGIITNASDPNTTITDLGIGPNVLQWSCDNGPCGVTSDDITLEATQFIGISEGLAPGSLPYYDPAHHQLVFSGQSAPRSIALFDPRGRMVVQMNNPKGAGAWRLPRLPSGVYLAQVRLQGGYATLRFVVGE